MFQPPRPTFRRDVSRKTGNLKVVQTLLGRSTIAITAEVYANVTVEDVRAAMEATTSAAPTELPPIEKKK